MLQLAGEKRLALNTDVNRYLKLKSLDSNIRGPVSLANLITHTGGFEEKLVQTAWHRRDQVLPLGQFLQNQMPARVLPAGKYICYSNHGFVLLGYIVIFIFSRFCWNTESKWVQLDNQELPAVNEQDVALLKKVNLINLVFLFSLIVAMLRTKAGSIWFGVSPVYYVILSLPLISGVLTVLLLIQASDPPRGIVAGLREDALC